jgi:hypothetical protein
LSATTSISAAQLIFERNRKRGFAALNEIFRFVSGKSTPSLVVGNLAIGGVFLAREG